MQVLCSLLLGVGYDAYVVSGYAPRAITHCDQSAANFPATDEGGAKQAEAEKAPPKYVVRPRGPRNQSARSQPVLSLPTRATPALAMTML